MQINRKRWASLILFYHHEWWRIHQPEGNTERRDYFTSPLDHEGPCCEVRLGSMPFLAEDTERRCNNRE